MLALLLFLILGLREYNLGRIPEVPIPDGATDFHVTHGLFGLYRYAQFTVPDSYPSNEVYLYYDNWLLQHGWRAVRPALSKWVNAKGWMSVEDLTGPRPIEWDMLHAEWAQMQGPYHVLLSLDCQRERGAERPSGMRVSLFVERYH